MQIDALDAECDLDIALDAVAVDNWEDDVDNFEVIDAMFWADRCPEESYISYDQIERDDNYCDSQKYENYDGPECYA